MKLYIKEGIDNIEVDDTAKNSIFDRMFKHNYRLNINWSQLHYMRPIYDFTNNYAIAFIFCSQSHQYLLSGNVPYSQGGEFHDFLIPLTQVYDAMKYDTNFNKKCIRDFMQTHTLYMPLDSIYVQYIIQYVFHAIKLKSESDEKSKFFKTYEDVIFKFEYYPLTYKFKHLNLQPRSNDPLHTRISLKKIPLSMFDCLNLDNIRSPFVREIKINKLISELVKTGVASCFPLFVDWTISKVIPFCFNNEFNLHKYMTGNIYYNSLTRMNEIRQVALNNVSGDSVINIYDYGLIKKMNDNITYIQKDLMFSKYCGIMMSEKQGKPLYQNIFDNAINITNDLDLFKAMFFQISYGIQAMTQHFGIIHMDLHIGNITVKNHIFKNMVKVIKKKSYLLKNTREFFIIDYGRSIISDFLTEDPDKDLIETLKIQNKKLKKQINAVMEGFYSENREFFDRTLPYHMKKYYRLFSCIDLMSLLKSFRTIYNRTIKREIWEFSFSVETFFKDLIKTQITTWKISENFEVVYPIISMFEQYYQNYICEDFIFTDNLNNIDNNTITFSDVIQEEHLQNITKYIIRQKKKKLGKISSQNIPFRETENSQVFSS